MDDRSSIVLPEDIVAEILVRLHIRPLFRFKLVSKQWKCIISDPKFAQYYLQRVRSSPKSSALWRHWGILFTYLNRCDEPRCLPTNDRDFNVDDIDRAPLSLYESVYSTYASWNHNKNLHDILASSNGLVLSCLPPTTLHTTGEGAWNKWSLELCVSNPLTKQSVKLPLLWSPYFPWAFGLATRAAQPQGENPTYITYKVVTIRRARRRVNLKSKTNLITIMIFSSDTGRWARKDLISCPTTVLISQTVIEAFTCRGIIHWFDQNRRAIVTYDPYESPDRFGLIWLPDSPGTMLKHSGMHLIHSGHENLLKYADIERRSEFDRRLHVWCLADYAKGEWRLEQTFLVSPLCEDSSLSGCGKLIAPDPWNANSFCMLSGTQNMVKAIDLGSAEVVYGDPVKVMAETGYWWSIMLLVHISLCPWSSPYNAQARSNTSTEVGFKKISAAWFPL